MRGLSACGVADREAALIPKGNNPLMKLKDYTAVIHLHSAYSYDGRASIPEILAAARKCAVDVLLLTDHSTIHARKEGYEGWQGGVLLVVGEEIAPRFNHYLAFGLREAVACAEKEPELPPQAYIDRVRDGGGVGFIAHPDHEGTALFHVKHYPWMDWTVTGYTGMGIWDFMTDWQKSLSGRIKAVLSYLYPAFFLRGPSAATLERWDHLTLDRRVVGIGELDNHDTLRRFCGIPLRVFPFHRVFHLIRTHILLEETFSGDHRLDIASVLNAMRNGRVYISLDRYRAATGFSMLMAERGREATMGDEFILHHAAEFQVRLPERARIRLIRNGTLFRKYTAKEFSEIIRDPGVYRIEADLNVLGRYHPWIWSNPIYATLH